MRFHDHTAGNVSGMFRCAILPPRVSELQELQKNGVAWLLQGWRIKVFRKPEYPGPIEVCTGVTEVRTVYGYRDYRVIDQGEVAAIGRQPGLCMT